MTKRRLQKPLTQRDLFNLGVSLSSLTVRSNSHAESAVEDGVFERPPPVTGNYFTDRQREVLDAVQMQLFPDDGNGPGARDLNALSYLEWAMTDPLNVADGDPSFIARGVDQLGDISLNAHGAGFIALDGDLKDAVLRQIAQSKFGKNWLSLLMFYITEALMLDPFYGGNPDMIGWMWLEHRPGFPRPVEGKTYRDFD